MVKLKLLGKVEFIDIRTKKLVQGTITFLGEFHVIVRSPQYSYAFAVGKDRVTLR